MNTSIDYYRLHTQPNTVVRVAAARRLLQLAKIFAGIALILMVVFYGPSLFYWARGGFQEGSNGSAIAATAKASDNDIVQKENYMPAFDTSLPAENKLTIPAIGVDTTISEAPMDQYESALKQGVWRAPDFNTPSNQSRPTILAAHRFGYLSWSNTFRRHNSFFNLPKLEVGDTVELVWKQRKYVYEVYAESQGTEITDYSADLILYTCNDLNSDVRIVKYARLVRI